MTYKTNIFLSFKNAERLAPSKETEIGFPLYFDSGATFTEPTTELQLAQLIYQ
jgi:hypothetical protein